MFSRIRKRLSYTNVLMTLALVFAMSGGAYAAGRYVITSTKQIKPSVLKQLQGKAGPAGKDGTNGTNGTNGAQGEKGPAGASGTNGTNGTNGVSVTTAEASQKECEDGGVKLTSVSGSNAVCNGKTGYAETLPSGKTETGEIGFEHENPAEGEKEFYTVSFPIPLAATVEPHFIGTNKELAGEENESPAIEEGKCKGDPEKPGAGAGNFCVFASVLGAATFKGFQDDGTLAEKATGLTGDGLFFKGKVEESQFPETYNPASLRATWAVTAE